MKDLKLLNLKGKELSPYIEPLAKLRIAIFKEYPYLYQGDFEYEGEYLSRYLGCASSFIVLVIDKQRVVGASTAMPMANELVEFQQPFLEQHRDVEDVFYLGESVLLPEYRGRGIYRQFFKRRERAAQAYGCRWTSFCAVERALDDPRRPIGYQSLDPIWQRFGYQKHSELSTHFAWKEVGSAQETANAMVFWLKKIGAAPVL